MLAVVEFINEVVVGVIVAVIVNIRVLAALTAVLFDGFQDPSDFVGILVCRIDKHSMISAEIHLKLTVQLKIFKLNGDDRLSVVYSTLNFFGYPSRLLRVVCKDQDETSTILNGLVEHIGIFASGRDIVGRHPGFKPF